MVKCIKRQKVIKKGTELFRCLNDASHHHGEQVNDEVCAVCPVQMLRKERACKKRKPPKSPPPPAISDEETVKLLIEDFNEDITVEEVKKYPPLYEQLLSYKGALSEWVKAGKPTRTQQEVEKIIEKFCKKCDWYDRKAHRCKGCGCKVSKSSIAIINKVKMGNQHCPKGLW